MIKLTAGYSKKIPAETEYSSQSYNAQLEMELSDGLTTQQLEEKIHGVFAFVSKCVEKELNNAGSTVPMQTPPQQIVTQQPVQQLPQVVQQQPVHPQTVPQQPVQPQQPYYAPQQNYQQPQSNQQNARPKNGGAVATTKQINYLLNLAKRAGWTIQQILQRCQIGALEQMPSRLCSQLIQEFSGTAA